jgi:hypothetical protein
VLNVAPLQTAAVAVAELLPGLTDAILERNPQLIGSGPRIALNVPYDNGRAEKMALPPSPPLMPPDEILDDEIDEELADEADDATPVIPLAETVADDVPHATNGVAHDTAPLPTTTLFAAPVEDAPRPARWVYEPPEADDAVLVETPAAPVATATDARTDGEPIAEVPVRDAVDEAFADEELAPVPHDDEPAQATTSFDAALEPLRLRMERSKLPMSFIGDLLVPDAVLDVSETALQWAGMPNKHERSLTSEIFFALAEWGFLAPRADGRYRVLRRADDPEMP